MRGQTKIAVAIGAVLTLMGIWYVNSDRQPAAVQVAEGPEGVPAGDSGADQTRAGNGSDQEGAPRGMASDRPSDSSSDVGSPAPRDLPEESTGLPGAGESFRPEPVATRFPVPPMSPTELPGGRAGLTSIVPNIGTSGLDRSRVRLDEDEDMPPNLERDTAAPESVLDPTIGEGPDFLSGPANSRPAASDARESLKETIPPVEPPIRTHTIQSGDTFTSLAVKYLGHAKYTNLVIKANPGKDPRRLYVGSKVNIPPLPGGPATKNGTPGVLSDQGTPAAAGGRPIVWETVPPPDPRRSYVVQPGEGWYDLARKFLGDGKDYPELYEYNKERVGGDPDLLRAGTIIELPPRAKMPAK